MSTCACGIKAAQRAALRGAWARSARVGSRVGGVSGSASDEEMAILGLDPHSPAAMAQADAILRENAAAEVEVRMRGNLDAAQTEAARQAAARQQAEYEAQRQAAARQQAEHEAQRQAAARQQAERDAAMAQQQVNALSQPRVVSVYPRSYDSDLLRDLHMARLLQAARATRPAPAHTRTPAHTHTRARSPAHTRARSPARARAAPKTSARTKSQTRSRSKNHSSSKKQTKRK